MDTLNVELAGVVVEAVGAAGIIATLLYLAKETRLHTAQIQADSLQASISSFVRQILSVSETTENSAVFRQGLHDFLGRDAATQNGFHAMMLGFVSAYHRTRALYEAGLIDDDEIKANERTMVGILRSPGAHEWWESWKIEPPQELIRHIEGFVSDGHPDVIAWSQKSLFRLEH